MIRSHGNVALSGHDHSPFLGDLCLLRLRLDGGEQKGRRRDKSNAPRGDRRSRAFDNLRHGHDDLHACRPSVHRPVLTAGRSGYRRDRVIEGRYSLAQRICASLSVPCETPTDDKFEEGALNDNTISRREFGMAAGAAGVGVIASSKSVAAREPGGPPLNYASGLIESPPTYYEVLEPAGGSTKPPMILICGRRHTAARYLATLSGRPGGAQASARPGSKRLCPDCPRVRPSAYLPIEY